MDKTYFDILIYSTVEWYNSELSILKDFTALKSEGYFFW